MSEEGDADNPFYGVAYIVEFEIECCAPGCNGVTYTLTYPKDRVFECQTCGKYTEVDDIEFN